MKIVIDIPEKMYKHILSMQFFIPGLRSGKSSLNEILKAIRMGTPLPEHHGDLIDKNKLTFNCMADVDCDHKNCNTCQYKCVAKYEIENSIVLKKEGSESE